MSRSESKPESCPKARRRRRWRLLWILPLTVLAVLLVERWRGHYALASWLQEARAHGETFEVKRLWPAPSVANREFSNRFARVVGELPPRLRDYSGGLIGIVRTSPGMARRGSQEPQPPMRSARNRTHTWEDLESLIDDSRAQLESLRELMKHPAGSMGYDINQFMEKAGALPNFIHVRVAAQTLRAATLTDLHRGNLEGALQNLEALYAFRQLCAAEPSLVGFMIRIVVLGLSDDVCWDALQAEGWSEPQLARLQRACECDLLARMPKTEENERAGRLSGFRWFAAHSYEDWLARNQAVLEVFESFGRKPPTCDTGVAVRRWRQWFFHPLWRFAWADQEELRYLQTVQGEVEIVREAVQRESWTELNKRMAEHFSDYRPPTAGWRFYSKLPLVDRLSDFEGTSPIPAQAYPYPNYSRAWLTAMRYLTWHEMVKTAVALKRFRLRYGAWPLNLTALTPEFLPALPRDLMNGGVLCYALNWNGGFTVYSVGQDGKDDAGDPTVWTVSRNALDQSPWDARDWLWPQNATPLKPGGSVTAARKTMPSVRVGR